MRIGREVQSNQLLGKPTAAEKLINLSCEEFILNIHKYFTLKLTPPEFPRLLNTACTLLG